MSFSFLRSKALQYGKMQTGWLLDGGKWYYLDKDNGDMVTGWKKLDRGQWYYFNKSGVAAQGWQKVDGYWYFFRICAMQTGWLYDGGKWYYLNADGKMRTQT